MSNYNAKYAVVQHALNPQARFLPACPLCAYWCSAGLIHHKTSAWHRHALAIRISFRIPAPAPPPPWPPGPAGSSGSDSRQRRQLRITAAACRRRAGRKPSSNPAAPRRKNGLRQATLGRRKLVVSLLELTRHVFVDYLVGYVGEHHVPGVRHLVVECQAAKAEK